jgi:hypothetical protein
MHSAIVQATKPGDDSPAVSATMAGDSAPSADKSGEPARGRVTDAERGMNLTKAYPKPLTT